jgi:hypothetical protein
MRKATLLLIPLLGLLSDLSAQSNVVPGLDGKLTDISSPIVWGRRGNPYPAGEIGFSVRNDMCNPGTVNIPWYSAMQEDHPKFGFMVTRLNNDRMEQVSNRSFCKHAFTSVNGSGGCGTCQNPGTGTVMGVHCTDAYGNSNNGDRNWLGPADEIDPWLGTWHHIGSYFDQGDPNVGPPQNQDGIRSPINVTDVVMNRVIMQEADLIVPSSTFFFQIHLVHQGEAVGNRGDNIMSRGVTFTWNGFGWTTGTVGTASYGSILTQWPGSTLNSAGNGNDDGRFFVAVKVTGPVNGMWHYEYAVHNVDNSRGGASFRIPICSAARVTGVGFHDIDKDALNDWTMTRSTTEIAFTAPASNPMNWNELFNFWFDSDAAPVGGQVALDEARTGTGNLSVSVTSSVPGFLPNLYLGDGCGTPTPTLFANGIGSIGNSSFALGINTTANASLIAFYSLGSGNTSLGNGCSQYLDSATLGTFGFLLANGAGSATLPLGVPPGLQPMDLNWQVVQLVPGGPVMNALTLSNGLRTRIGGTGCQ